MAFTALLLAVQPSVAAPALGAPAPSGANNAAIDKQVQEALAKAQTQQGASKGQGAKSSSEALSKLIGKGKGAATTATTPTVPTVTNSSTSSSGALTTGVIVPIVLVGGGLLVGIAFLILRDARSVAPASDVLVGGGSAQERAARLRKRRAKAKAARRQRKRNR